MKFDACIASVKTSAGAVVITSRDAILYGISASGSAAAATLVVFAGTNTAGATVFFCPIPATAGYTDGPMAPVVCAGGITCTNVGTLAGYVVHYANLRGV